MAHIIFREFVGFDKYIPMWLDEGVAMLAEADTPERLQYAAQLALSGNHMALEEISNIRGYDSLDPYVFFSQSASLVDFLLNQYGRNSFIDFFRQLRDGDNWQEALEKVYRFTSLEDFEESWLSFISQNY